MRRGGIFDQLTFCLPLLDSPVDITPAKMAQLAKAITSQGGKLVELREAGRSAKYILVDERADVGMVQEALRGKMIYSAIISYKWVEDCIRKFVRLGLAPYNLESDYQASEDRKARRREERKEAEPTPKEQKED